MKTKDLKGINTKRYLYGRGKDTLFYMNYEVEEFIAWVCTHGGWEIWTDKQGKYLAGSVKIDIEEVYVENQFIGLYGMQKLMKPGKR